jgi:hypothetical protein
MMLLILLFDLAVIYGWIVTFHNTSSDVKIGGSVIMTIVTIAAIIIHIRFMKGPPGAEDAGTAPLLQPEHV